jgi:hypothetical protein
LASEWKVGDLVVFNEDPNSSQWQGGLGEVIKIEPDLSYSIVVKVQQVPPKVVTKTTYLASTQRFHPESLLPYEEPSTQPKEAVDHPDHYGGDTTYEVFKVVEAWGLDEDAYLFNVVKYVARAKKKGKFLEDLKKARVYIDRRIKQLEGAQ